MVVSADWSSPRSSPLEKLRRSYRLLRSAGLPTRSSSASADARERFTFDVFDTLLSRVVEPPEMVWFEVAHRAIETRFAGDPARFVDERRRAARVLRARGGHPTLEGIYALLGERLHLEELEWRSLAELEMTVESAVIRPVPGGRRLLEAARSANPETGIVFISDMHLPSTFIREKLREHGMWEPGDRLWVSCEAGARKSDATLFHLVRSHEFSLADHPIHVGDSELSDNDAAIWAGFGARAYTAAVSNRYEQALASYATSPQAIAGWMAGVSKQTRLELPTDLQPPVRRTVRQVGVNVVGPFLVSYCLWLLRRAVEEGLDRLYFISRDGEILWQVTRVVAAELGISIELRYLYGGRLSWQYPALATDSLREPVVGLVLKTVSAYTVVHPSDVGARLGLGRDAILELMDSPRRAAGSDDRELSQAERAQLVHLLTTGAGVEMIRENAAASLPLVIEYLRQEGLFDDSKWALVDVGWRGNTVRTFNKLLRHGGGVEARVFFTGYFGTPGMHRLPGCEAFIWDSDHADPLPRPAGALAIVEAICSGSHGPVAGYARHQDGTIRPVLLEEFGQAAKNWWLTDLREAVMLFLTNLAPHLKPAHLSSADPRAALAVLTELCDRPTAEEAAAIGSCPREEDAQGGSVFPVARAFQLGDLPKLLRSGKSVGRNLAWRPGALAMTSPTTRAIVRAALAISDVSRSLRS